ncbi:TVP38/TMEM64 family protein [Planococcus lenghuensis]|uniref:TVP38/TMEM64 family protein n=1 Tax=Planococcus lenghuensis TaxID=2213202 RepID=UPI001E4D38A9|nr:VTT domain-containing protein [Planococcus lenghuensis]
MEQLSGSEYTAVILSIFVGIVVAILAVIPSVFVTSANILVFGFWEGAFLSFLGEAIGAVVAFLLYQFGLRNISRHYLHRFSSLQRLVDVQGKEAFFLIFALRLTPFTPSSIVTYFASIGKVSWQTFAVASSLGKIPALLLEAYSIYHLVNWTIEGKLLLLVIGGGGIIWILTRRLKNR